MPGRPPAAAGGDSPEVAGVLRALQSLSSEFDAARLTAGIEDLVGPVAGATKVVLALWDQDSNDWVCRADATDATNSGAQNVDDLAPPAPTAGAAPLTVLSHVASTGEPLVLPDAVADNFFSGDAYFQGIDCCSMMVVPILHHGQARAMMILENREVRGAFDEGRRHAVLVIAAQLAVTLENVHLYERMERKLTDQTHQLRHARAQALAQAQRASAAQSATNVLHNVGNVLTSVNVSAHMLSTQVRQSPGLRIGEVARLLDEQAGDLEAFFAPGGKGRLLPGYLRELASALGTEREQLLAELDRLRGSVDHISNVVKMQQTHAASSRMLEFVSMGDLVDDALRMQAASMTDLADVQVQRDYSPVKPAALDRTRVMQILVNLLDNARQAVQGVPGERFISVRVWQEDGSLLVSVRDSGCGISAEAREQLFTHGYTTKADGHGFGLHSCAAAALEMGGGLSAHSDGPGMGATFVLRLPAA